MANEIMVPALPCRSIDEILDFYSHGMAERAAVILDGALERTQADASAVELVDALAYRAELAVRSGDTAGAVAALARARAVPLSADDRDHLTETLSAMDDLDVLVGATEG